MLFLVRYIVKYQIGVVVYFYMLHISIIIISGLLEWVALSNFIVTLGRCVGRLFLELLGGGLLLQSFVLLHFHLLLHILLVLQFLHLPLNFLGFRMQVLLTEAQMDTAQQTATHKDGHPAPHHQTHHQPPPLYQQLIASVILVVVGELTGAELAGIMKAVVVHDDYSREP